MSNVEAAGPIFNKVGILHPGAMGVAVAASVKNSGCEVHWCSEGRGSRTRDRAEHAGLLEVATLAALCERCDLIISVCPPEFAESLAEDVVRLGFRGTYLDANAVAPARKQRMAVQMEAAGIRFVDGGIIGLPPKKLGETWMLLSGPQAAEVATCFAAGPMEPEVIGAEIGQASAAKACFAAYNKGSIALAISVLRTADHYGVREDLERHWARRGAKFAQVETEIVRAAPKAWRWAPEMLELAATLDAAGESPKFHEAAATLFERLGDFKDADGISLDDVIRRLR
jgi:3-hydroxyisobutyrate dehydrogenase-like beta-hydroxyacid dehydrogenase